MQLTEAQQAFWDAIMAARKSEICVGCEGVLGQCVFDALTSSPSEANMKTIFGMSAHALATKSAECVNGEVKDAVGVHTSGDRIG